ncbi:MAG: EthD family reductase [Acidobacteriota bacterium]|nr:EthD family reductase [Acidobacteriota bacterium]
MIVVSVLYPKTSDSRFDLSYYLQKHTPMVRSLLTPLGMESLTLLKGAGTLEGTPAPFEVIAQLQFSTPEHLENAMSLHGAEIIGDIPNFSNVHPLIQMNEPL